MSDDKTTETRWGSFDPDASTLPDVVVIGYCSSENPVWRDPFGNVIGPWHPDYDLVKDIDETVLLGEWNEPT